MARATRPLFTADTFRFLNALALNNHRDWFDANREAYEKLVREPALELIRVMAPRLRRISQHLVASDRKQGGSLMRVHRDVRFSRDKQPYKTNVGIQFRHAAGKDVHAPGYYLHVAPSGCFFGCGVWHPDAAALANIRRYIDEKPAAWKRVVCAPDFADRFDRDTEALSRAPKGYPPDHPLIEDLKRKSHIAMAPLRRTEVLSASLPDTLSANCAASKPFMKLLSMALGLAF